MSGNQLNKFQKIKKKYKKLSSASLRTTFFKTCLINVEKRRQEKEETRRGGSFH